MRRERAQGLHREPVGSLFLRALIYPRWGHLMLVTIGFLLISGCQQGPTDKIVAPENLATELRWWLPRNSHSYTI